ncbi:MAG: arsenic resistance protein [Pseudomonadota bacterium]
MTLQDPSLAADSKAAPAPFSTAVFFIGAIILGGCAGLFSLFSTETFSQGIEATLLVMIFLLFFELRLGAIFNSFRSIGFLSLAWVANFLIVPVIALAVAGLVFSGQPLLFAGLMLYFLAPCTDWFLGFTRLAKGDTELGAALIPINIITQLLLFPFWLWLLTKSTGLADFEAMPRMLMQWFVFPLLAAQSLRFVLDKLLPQTAYERVLSGIDLCVPGVLAALIFQIFATHIGEITGQLNMVALVTLAVCLFFIATLVTGKLLSRLARLTYPQQALLSMTMAARNAPLMLALTAVAIPDQPIVLVVIVAGMLVEIPLLTALKQLLLKRTLGRSKEHVFRTNHL